MGQDLESSSLPQVKTALVRFAWNRNCIMTKPSFEKGLKEVWRQALVENAKTVEIGSALFPVRRTPKRGLRQVDFTSTTDWDRYIRTLTPDLPTRFSDFASELVSRDKVETLWHLISTLDPHQKSLLIDWYRKVGLSITGAELSFPQE